MISIGALCLTWDYSLGTMYLAAGLIVGSSFFVSIYLAGFYVRAGLSTFGRQNRQIVES
jgi:F0F1-type ATP synthase membrane subunit c/vacuolar-type H+-ATPase subunit K